LTTFCAIDADTKLVPSFKVGERDLATANAFVSDVAGRLENRVQISSDALRAYVEAAEQTSGANVDFAQIVKAYVFEEGAERHYSAPRIVITKKEACCWPSQHGQGLTYIEELRDVIRHLHGVESKHVECVPIKETFPVFLGHSSSERREKSTDA
jgi:hypothetical protein